MKRVPQVLVFSTIQPIIFVLMFRYVFGGAISPGAFVGVPYVDFLMPGIFVQTITFGSMQTGVGLADDLTKGLIERFRSLPMARSAVLAGRTVADLTRNVFVFALMTGVGFAVGFRIHTNVFAFSAGLLILLLFTFALSWIFAFVGLAMRNAEAAQAAAFPLVAPMVFASSAFVPLSSQPGWLQVFSAHQPVTLTVERDPRPVHRRADGRPGRAEHRLVDRHHRGVRTDRRPEVPPGRLSLPGVATPLL